MVTTMMNHLRIVGTLAGCLVAGLVVQADQTPLQQRSKPQATASKMMEAGVPRNPAAQINMIAQQQQGMYYCCVNFPQVRQCLSISNEEIKTMQKIVMDYRQESLQYKPGMDKEDFLRRLRVRKNYRRPAYRDRTVELTGLLGKSRYQRLRQLYWQQFLGAHGDNIVAIFGNGYVQEQLGITRAQSDQYQKIHHQWVMLHSPRATRAWQGGAGKGQDQATPEGGLSSETPADVLIKKMRKVLTKKQTKMVKALVGEPIPGSLWRTTYYYPNVSQEMQLKKLLKNGMAPGVRGPVKG